MSRPFLLTLFALTCLLPTAAVAACGDGILDSGELCDDLNTSPGDGCDATCSIETGWNCTAASFNLSFEQRLYDDQIHDTPNWSLSNSAMTVTQSVNSDPAVYVSTLPAAGVTIAFDLTVNTYYDDDFIGWAIGYQDGDHDNPAADWLLFDWKQEHQWLSSGGGHYAAQGLYMWRVQGAITQVGQLWGHSGPISLIAAANTLGDAAALDPNGDPDGDGQINRHEDNPLGTGWNDYQTYRIEISYSTSLVQVWVDGVQEFNVAGIFPTGNFGFYNYSQADIVYTLISPTDQSICSMADSDSDGIVDLDELAIGTDPYDPDSDGDGLGDLTEVVDPQAPQNSDEDSLIDALDPDDDGDGVPTIDEDLNGDGNPATDDSDGDSIPNYLDEDDDGDGLFTLDEDPNGNGLPGDDDTDGDGLANYLDVDSDGDSSGDAVDCEPLDPVIYPGATEQCNGLDDDCDPNTFADAAGEIDGDGDGSLSCVDCDDANATNFPTNSEICDGADNDCNQLADFGNPGSLGLEEDGDGDGWAACADCDDGDSSNFPGNVELCDGQDNNCNNIADFDPIYGEFDVDLDGILGCLDCDDANAANFPGNAEYCDGQDNDCDEVIDENDAVDTTTWHQDADEDGYGSPTATVLACDLPPGYVGDASDCDDSDASVNLDGTEVCDGVDNDCNDAVDEPEATDARSWNRDADGDGYGDPLATTVSCEQPTGYVDENTDCNDDNSAVNPGEDEIWYDGIDQDCDGNDDDRDSDGHNNAEDCNDQDPEINPAAVEIWYDGVDQDCDGNDDDQDYDQFTRDDDCNDEDPEVNPAAVEVWYDGVDQDCDGNDDDQDRDGFSIDADCDDLNPELNWRCVAEGCGCSAASSEPNSGLSLLLLALLSGWRRRRPIS